MDGGMVDEHFAGEADMLDEDISANFQAANLTVAKGKIRCELCGKQCPDRARSMRQMRLHLEQEHADEFARFAVQERARMRDSFTSFLQATMGLSEDKSFVLPDGSTAEMKPGMVPDLRAHFQNLLEKDQAGELGDDDEAAEGLFGNDMGFGGMGGMGGLGAMGGEDVNALLAELQRLKAQEGDLLEGMDLGEELGGLD